MIDLIPSLTPFFHPTSVPGLVYLGTGRRQRDMSLSGSPVTAGGAIDTLNSVVGPVVLTQGTGANQPLFTANGSNDWSTILFDGAGDHLVGDTAFNALTNNVTSLTVVLAVNWVAFGGADTWALGFSVGTGASVRASIGAGANSSGSAARRMVGRSADADSATIISAGATYPTGMEILIGVWNFVTKTGTMWRNGTRVMNPATFTNMTAAATSATDSQSSAVGALGGGGTSSNIHLADLALYTNYVPNDGEIRLLTRYYGNIHRITVP